MHSGEFDMKKLLVFAALALGTMFAHAEGKIAVVNMEMAMLNTNVIKAKEQELQADPTFKKNIQEVQIIKNDYLKLVEKYKKESVTMSASQKQQLEEEIKNKQSDGEYIAGKLKDAQETAIKPLLIQMQPQAQTVIKEIITSEGIGLLLSASMQNQTVIYADTSYDITSKVTDKLNNLTKKP